MLPDHINSSLWDVQRQGYHLRTHVIEVFFPPSPSLLPSAGLFPDMQMSWSWMWMILYMWRKKRMTTGTEATTCGQGRGASSQPFMPMRSSASLRSCWVSGKINPLSFNLSHCNCIRVTCYLCILTLHPVGMKRNPAWIETFSVQFLGSVEVPYHQGNGILCAAMQKVRQVENREIHAK